MSISDVNSIRDSATALGDLDNRQQTVRLVGVDSADLGTGGDEGSSLRSQLTIANIITTGSLLAGLVALLEAVGATPMPTSRLRVVVALIGVAALLDAIDGPIARMRHTTGPFGCNLDSLADMVAFGVVPAVALYHAQLQQVPVAGVLVATVFCACAAWRLARFPLCQSSHRFLGCPVPLAAVIAGIAAVLFSSTVVTLATVGSLSWLMIGTLHFPTWNRVLGRVPNSNR